MKDFDTLPKHKKVEIVFQKASYVGSIRYYNQTLMLYQLESVFFEVWYDQMENDVIEILIADKNRLHLYCPTLSELRQGL